MHVVIFWSYNSRSSGSGDYSIFHLLIPTPELSELTLHPSAAIHWSKQRKPTSWPFVFNRLEKNHCPTLLALLFVFFLFYFIFKLNKIVLVFFFFFFFSFAKYQNESATGAFRILELPFKWKSFSMCSSVSFCLLSKNHILDECMLLCIPVHNS